MRSKGKRTFSAEEEKEKEEEIKQKAQERAKAQRLAEVRKATQLLPR